MRHTARAASALVVVTLWSAATDAQVYNVPPGSAPAVLNAGETLNLGAGGTTPTNSDFLAGSVVNVQGGQLGSQSKVKGELNLFTGSIGPLNASTPARINMYGGTSTGFIGLNGATWNMYGGMHTDFFFVGQNSVLNIYDGKMGTPTSAQNGVINLFGGSLGYDLNFTSSILNQTGGAVDAQYQIPSGSTWNISGGTFQHGVMIRGTLNIKAKTALLGGAPISGLMPGSPRTITERNLFLTGILLDNTPYQFELNSGPVSGLRDYFPQGSLVTVTLVPEPKGASLGAAVLVALMLMTSGRKVMRRCP